MNAKMIHIANADRASADASLDLKVNHQINRAKVFFFIFTF